MSKITVIYHRADYDGIFCREIARKFIPDAEFIGWDHGDPKIPTPPGEFFVLDLSPECLSDFDTADHGHTRIVWIDHHKSSIERFDVLNSYGKGYRIDGVAACRLAWQWFSNASNRDNVLGNQSKSDFIDRNVSEPLAVRLAGEYDIWDKRDPRAELFQHGLRSRELTPEWWNDLLGPNSEVYCGTLLDAGGVLQYSKTKENESIIKSAGFTIKFEGLKFLACNHARYNSFLFTAGLTTEHDGCLGFAWKGGKWTISLYHAPGKENHDLSLIAVKHGGGGHRGACGFTCKELPFKLA